MKKIVFIGGYGYSDVGDESQLSTDLINLRKYVPNAKFLVLSDNPDYSRKYHEVEADYSINRYLLIASRRNAGKIERKILRKIRFLRITQFLKGLLFVFNARRLRNNKKSLLLEDDEKKLLKNLKNADLLFNVGGGNLNSIYHLELYGKCFTYLICRTFGKPIVLSGQSVGPFNNWLDKCFVRFALNRVNVITLREKISEKVIKDIDAPKPVVIATADDATLLPPASQEKVKAVFLNEKISLHRPLIAVNIYKHSILQVHRTKEKKVTRLLAEISDYLISKHDARIIFLSTSYRPETDDRVAASNILKLMKHKDEVRIITNEYNDRMIKGITGQMDLVLGLRYHFIVFAVTSQVPSIGIYMDPYYSIKINGILKLVEQEEYACDIEKLSLKDLINLTEKILSNKESIRKKLRERTKELGKLSLISIKYAKKFLMN